MQRKSRACGFNCSQQFEVKNIKYPEDFRSIPQAIMSAFASAIDSRALPQNEVKSECLWPSCEHYRTEILSLDQTKVALSNPLEAATSLLWSPRRRPVGRSAWRQDCRMDLPRDA